MRRIATAHSRRAPGPGTSECNSKVFERWDLCGSAGTSLAAHKRAEGEFHENGNSFSTRNRRPGYRRRRKRECAGRRPDHVQDELPVRCRQHNPTRRELHVTPMDDDPSVLELSNGKVSVLLDTQGDQQPVRRSKLK